MVDVAHDGHDRRTGLQVLGLVRLGGDEVVVLGKTELFHFEAELRSGQGGGLHVQGLVDGDQRAESEQDLDEILGLGAHLAGQVGDPDGLLHADLALGRLHGLGAGIDLGGQEVVAVFFALELGAHATAGAILDIAHLFLAALAGAQAVLAPVVIAALGGEFHHPAILLALFRSVVGRRHRGAGHGTASRTRRAAARGVARGAGTAGAAASRTRGVAGRTGGLASRFLFRIGHGNDANLGHGRLGPTGLLATLIRGVALGLGGAGRSRRCGGVGLGPGRRGRSSGFRRGRRRFFGAGRLCRGRSLGGDRFGRRGGFFAHHGCDRRRFGRRRRGSLDGGRLGGFGHDRSFDRCDRFRDFWALGLGLGFGSRRFRDLGFGRYGPGRRCGRTDHPGRVPNLGRGGRDLGFDPGFDLGLDHRCGFGLLGRGGLGSGCLHGRGRLDRCHLAAADNDSGLHLGVDHLGMSGLSLAHTGPHLGGFLVGEGAKLAFDLDAELTQDMEYILVAEPEILGNVLDSDLVHLDPPLRHLDRPEYFENFSAHAGFAQR